MYSIISTKLYNPFARRLARYMKMLCVPVECKKLSDGEVYVRVKGVITNPVVLVGTTAPPSDNIVELLLLINAIRESNRDTPIIVVFPYLGYARADRSIVSGEAVSARAVAELFNKNTVQHVIGIDIHSIAAEAFFKVPLTPVYAYPYLAKQVKKYINPNKTVIVSPDRGASLLAQRMGKLLNCKTAWFEKKRPSHNQVSMARFHGMIRGSDVVVVDDMIDTAGTMVAAIACLKKYGAHRILVAATHGVLSGDAIHRLQKAHIDQLILSDSIPRVSTLAIENLSLVSMVPAVADILTQSKEL